MEIKINTLEDLFSEAELKEYNATAYPFNLKILDAALKAKTLQDPDYEVWVPLTYYRFAKFAKNKAEGVIAPYGVYVSNKGEVCRRLKGKVKTFSKFLNIQEDGYYLISIANNLSVTLHRLLGCCFIPIPDKLGIHHPKNLQVNHIDGDKLNFELSNLEWATFSMNINHAYQTGLRKRNPLGITNAKTKLVKGAILHGKFKGYEFTLAGHKDRSDNGFNPTLISACCCGYINNHRFCSWSYVEKNDSNEYPQGLTDEIKESLDSLEVTGTSVIEVTNVITGEVFEIPSTMIGIKAAGFSPSSVFRVLSGDRLTYRKHQFKRKTL